ncbi:MAG: hypothetical protein ACRD3N_19535 [Terracidiphilus sp.]
MIAEFNALASGSFSQGHFFEHVFDKWSTGAQEFVSDRLPHLVVDTVIALVLIQILHMRLE